MHSPNLRTRLDRDGLIGPFQLSASTHSLLQPLTEVSTSTTSPRNLHATNPIALQVIRDFHIINLVRSLFGSGYSLWRTNFFHRQIGLSHPGVPLHHVKHFVVRPEAICRRSFV